MCIEGFYSVLTQNGCKVGVGYKVTSHGRLIRETTIDLPESLLFRQKPSVRQIDERLDIGRRLFWCQGMQEDGRMCSDSQVAHYGWPRQVEQPFLPDALLQKRASPFVVWASRIRSIEKDVDVEGETHLPSSRSTGRACRSSAV